MKKIRLICLLMACFLTMSIVGGCRGGGGTQIDETRSQLNIGILNDGVGSGFADELIKDFEEYYAETSFEDGKMGVEVIPEAKKDPFLAGTLETSMPFSENTLWFAEINYTSFVNKGLIIDISKTVNEKVYDEDGELAEKTGKPAKQSIVDTMYPEYKDTFKTNDDKYYAIPFRFYFTGITYDADLINNNNLYFLKNGSIGGNANMVAQGNCSTGPDGIMGTSDDGMPNTWNDFIKWIDAMVGKQITPFTWSGTTDYQRRMAYRYIWANYEGANDYMLNYTFNGVDSQFGQITDANYPTLIGQNGRKAGIKAAKDITSKSKYYSTLADKQTYTEAQEEYAYSVMTDNKIAMFFEGSYWESEAKGTFDKMPSELGYGKRNFKWLPVPNFIGVDGVPDQTKAMNDRVLDASSAYEYGVYISAKNTCKNYDTQVKIAKLFLQFAQQRSQLVKFVKNTGCTWRPYNFTVKESELNEWTGIAKSIYKFIEEGATVVSSFPYSEVRKLSGDRFSEGAWDFAYTLYSEPFAYFMNVPNRSVEQCYTDMFNTLTNNFKV